MGNTISQEMLAKATDLVRAILEAVNRPDGALSPQDVVQIHGGLAIEIYDGDPKDGKLERVIECPNTILNAGLGYLINAYKDSSGNIVGVNSIAVIHGAGTVTVATTGETVGTTTSGTVLFRGTYPVAGTYTSIGTIQLRRNALVYNQVTVSPFNKDDEKSLVTRWTVAFV